MCRWFNSTSSHFFMNYIIFSRIIGSILFISGTSIGAGMLGLPIRTIGIEIYFVCFLFFIVWFFMTLSALAMLEISLWLPGNTNIISISKFIFGRRFSILVGLFYILFLYSLISAYISGGSSMLIDLFAINCENFYCHSFFCILFISPFFLIIFFGFGVSDYINRFFFVVLIITYIFLTINIINVINLDVKNFKFLDISLCFFSLPIILTSFGYSLLIPSLKNYLFNNVRFLVFSIILGGFIPFLVYIFWEYFIYSFLFNISNKLFVQTLFGYGNPAEKLMVLIGNNNVFILYVISFFSLSALISSLIGVALSLYYFFFDALSLSYNSYLSRFFCVLIVFFIPIIFSIFFPHGFMFFLSYAGAIASVLLVIFPVYTLWYGRYIKKFSYHYILFDSKFILSLLLLFGFLVFFIDLFFIYFV